MFNTISSINPLVFISTPIERLFLVLSPKSLAGMAVPPNLPTIATRMTSPQVNHKSGVFNNPISVRKPVNTKNKGKSKETETSSTLSTMIRRKLVMGGITTPARKAPNSA
ncbi:MAG: hypothetical protein BWY72_02446 [Bacteroidetes bacterium ADurb.Bin416]|nr:MAG: hypothetical protein BWY72_02446 [Bacteroidetes bacterium ADurb.Bin416]